MKSGEEPYMREKVGGCPAEYSYFRSYSVTLYVPASTNLLGLVDLRARAAANA